MIWSCGASLAWNDILTVNIVLGRKELSMAKILMMLVHGMWEIWIYFPSSCCDHLEVS